MGNFLALCILGYILIDGLLWTANNKKEPPEI